MTREDAIEWFKAIQHKGYYSNFNETDSEALAMAIEALKTARIVQITTPEGMIFGLCSACKEELGYPYRYCPWCGAKIEMRHNEPPAEARTR